MIESQDLETVDPERPELRGHLQEYITTTDLEENVKGMLELAEAF